MINYFYTANYDEKITQNEVQDSSLSDSKVHVWMFALTDKYNIRKLQILSATKYANEFKYSSTSVEFLKSFSDVYELTAVFVRTFWNQTVNFARHNLAKSLKNLTVKQVYNDIITEISDFVKKLLDLYLKTSLIEKCFDCEFYQAMKALQIWCWWCYRKTNHANYV